MRRLYGAAAAAVLVLAIGGCGNKAETGGGGGGAAANWPQRDLRIMAPADPGGGWDSTARAMGDVIRKAEVVDKGVEVYNVPGAGGTIGLSQLSSKQSGKSNELMVMGLVMLGAIQTNKSPVDLTKTTPLASLTTEPEAIAVQLEVALQDARRPRAGHEGRPGQVLGRRRLGRRHRPDPPGAAREGGGRRPVEAEVRRLLGGGEALQSILSGSVDAGISGVSEFADQVEAGKMRVLAVSGAEGVDVAGKPVKSISEQGLDVEITNWRGVVGPPDIKPAERDAAIEALQKMHDSAEWQDAMKQNDWQDFFKTGDDFQSYIDSENERVKGILGEIGLTE